MTLQRIQFKLGTTLAAGERPVEGEPLWDDVLRRVGFWNTSGQDFDWFRWPRTSKGENLSFIPDHQYDPATHRLRFQQADGEWGDWMEIQGEPGESVEGPPGVNGRAAGVSLAYSSIVLDQDPGAGKFSFNSVSPNLITTMYVHRSDMIGTNITGWLDNLDTVLNTASRGIVHAQALTGGGTFFEVNVTGVVVIDDLFARVPVAFVSGVMPDAGYEMALSFTPAGRDASTAYIYTSTSFMGNGTAGPYTLPWTPVSEDALDLSIEGAVQSNNAFTLTGNQILFADVVTTEEEVFAKNTAVNTLLVPDAESVDASKLKTSDVAAMRTKLSVYNKAFIDALVARIEALETP